MQRGLPDLHRHLDGSLRRATLEELAREDGVAMPEELGFRAGMGIDEALARFAFTLARLETPARVERVAAEICEDAGREGVGTLEVRFAPQLHRGAPMGIILDAAASGVAGRAGLVLCGLYGEPPAILEALVELARTRPAVVGIDLAGAPSPGARWGLPDYAKAFRAAARAGLGRTVHASEGRPPAELRAAIELLGATRIGHGTTLLEDEEVLALVLAREVTIEACPTSNVHTGAIAELAAHPLARWLERGVRACVNPDNTLFSATDAAEEHRRARALPGMSDPLLELAIGHGHAAAFPRRA